MFKTSALYNDFLVDLDLHNMPIHSTNYLHLNHPCFRKTNCAKTKI